MMEKQPLAVTFWSEMEAHSGLGFAGLFCPKGSSKERRGLKATGRAEVRQLNALLMFAKTLT